MDRWARLVGVVFGVAAASCAPRAGTKPAEHAGGAAHAPKAKAKAKAVAVASAGPAASASVSVEVPNGIDRADEAPADALFEVAPHPREWIKAPARPEVSEVGRVDYESLPLLGEVPLTKSDDESFWMVVTDRSANFCAPGMPRQKLTWRFSRHWSHDAVLRIGGALTPSPRILDGAYEDDELYSRLVVAAWDPGGENKHMSFVGPADWLMFDRAPSGETASVARYEGRFSDMAGRATKAERGEARALVPSELFAFRRCTAHCDAPLGSADRVEELTIVGPPALWDGSSGEAELSQAPQAFSALSAPVKPGASAALVLDFPRAAAAGFARTSVDPSGPTAYEVDVVWPAGEGPSLEVFAGQTQGKPDEIHEKRITYSRDTGPCL